MLFYSYLLIHPPTESNANKYLIKSMTIKPIHLYITLSISHGLDSFLPSQSPYFLWFRGLIKTIGTLLLNIDQANLNIEEVSLKDIIDYSESIANRIILDYTPLIISQIHLLFASLNIIGNPLQLFGSIKTGLAQLMDESVKGVTNGIKVGIISFFCHSMWGILNTLEKVIGGFSINIFINMLIYK